MIATRHYSYMKNNNEVKQMKQQQAVVQQLRAALSDTYALYFKTHSYHWNVEGMDFNSLHNMFEAQYTEMWQATDELAERLRALDAYAPINYAQMVSETKIAQDNNVPNAKQMVKNLANGHETLIKTLGQALAMAQVANDEVTSDTLLGRMQVHEKTLWMLKSLSK